MDINEEFIKGFNSLDLYLWFKDYGETDLEKIVRKLIDEKKVWIANSLLTSSMNKKQCVKYTIYIAKSIIVHFDLLKCRFGNPVFIVNSAEKWLENNSEKNRILAMNEFNNAIYYDRDSISESIIYIAALSAWCAGQKEEKSSSINYNANKCAEEAESIGGNMIEYIEYGLSLFKD